MWPVRRRSSPLLEAEEEVGLRPLELELLTGFHNSVGFCDEFVHVFLATAFQAVETSTMAPRRLT